MHAFRHAEKLLAHNTCLCWACVCAGVGGYEPVAAVCQCVFEISHNCSQEYRVEGADVGASEGFHECTPTLSKLPFHSPQHTHTHSFYRILIISTFWQHSLPPPPLPLSLHPSAPLSRFHLLIPSHPAHCSRASLAIKGKENTNESRGLGVGWGRGGGSLGFQYDSEWEKGRWEGKVGSCEEREEYMGGMSLFLFILSDSLLSWNTDEGIKRGTYNWAWQTD